MITEDECARRISAAVGDLNRRNQALQNQLKEAEYRVALAEWAVAGVISRNLHLNIDISPQMLTGADPAALTMHIGRTAGREFLHAAELEFKMHAEYAKLQQRVMGEYAGEFLTPSAIPDRPWPRPF